MKKMLAMILALAMVLSMSVTAFAATIEDAPGSAAEDVTVDISAGVTKYHVVVTWTSMDFKYTKGEWNVTDHEYEEGVWGSNGNTATITVMNNSNASIWYQCSVQDTKADDAFTFVLDNAKKEIQGAHTDGFYGNPVPPTAEEVLTVNVDVDKLANTQGIETVGMVTIAITHS